MPPDVMPPQGIALHVIAQHIIAQQGPLEWTALLPPLVAIGLAFATRKVTLSLALGIVAGGVALWLRTGDLRDLEVISRFLVPSIVSRSYAMILLVYLACIGGMIGIWQRTGAARQLAERIGARTVRGPKSALLFAWACGVLFHQGGTVSCVLSGFTARPLADKNRVSHEELSFVVDAMASPVAAVIPLNAWPAIFAGILVATAPPLIDDMAGLDLFLRSIPYNGYAWLMIGAALLVACGVLPPRSRLKRAARRAREHGLLDDEGARPLVVDRHGPGPLPGADNRPADRVLGEWPGYHAHASDVWLPLAILLLVTALVYLATGALRFDLAFALAVIALAMISHRHGLPWIEVWRALAMGWRRMLLGAIVLGLAVTLGMASREAGAGAYLIATVGDAISYPALPALALTVAAAIAFATGTSFGAAAIVIPALVPLAWSLQPDPEYLALVVGSITGGAVFGDQASPLSDTTILASMFTGADPMHHTRSQLPIALACAAMAAVFATIVAIAR